MQPQFLSVTATGTTVVNAIKVLDTFAPNFNVGVAMLFSGPVSTALVEYTLEDVTGTFPNPNGTTVPTWFSLIAARSSNTTASLPIPAAAIRLQSTNGTGVITLAIVQTGIGMP